jgi:hypothetical protein
MSRGGNVLARTVGVGDYPGDPCFDASRATWLPYWIPNFTETNCASAHMSDLTKNAIQRSVVYAGVTAPPGAAAPGAPPATLQQGPIVIDPAVADTIGPDSAQMARDASLAAWQTWADKQDAANNADTAGKTGFATMLAMAAVVLFLMVRR